jgi:hypothetical protein
MIIRMVMVMRTKIGVIRVTRVSAYLSGTPPGFSLSARFLAGPRPSGGTLKSAPPETRPAPPDDLRNVMPGVNFAFIEFSEVAPGFVTVHTYLR